ncbi:MAG: response regulator [Deltaproteobacteria bacterium]|nr:response regulator [Deltaproteobacteria bacterium]
MVKKVLIIDDNPQAAEVARQALTAAGMEATVNAGPFGSTMTALRIKPDLILLDATMPGLSGERVLQLIKQEPALRGVIVLFYSAIPEDELRELTERTGANGFIPKTVRPSELMKRVAAALAQA